MKVEEKMLIFGLAALFRAAGLVRASDSESTEAGRDLLSINQAKRFIQTCRDKGIYPEDS